MAQTLQALVIMITVILLTVVVTLLWQADVSNAWIRINLSAPGIGVEFAGSGAIAVLLLLFSMVFIFLRRERGG